MITSKHIENLFSLSFKCSKFPCLPCHLSLVMVFDRDGGVLRFSTGQRSSILAALRSCWTWLGYQMPNTLALEELHDIWNNDFKEKDLNSIGRVNKTFINTSFTVCFCSILSMVFVLILLGYLSVNCSIFILSDLLFVPIVEGLDNGYNLIAVDSTHAPQLARARSWNLNDQEENCQYFCLWQCSRRNFRNRNVDHKPNKDGNHYQ